MTVTIVKNIESYIKIIVQYGCHGSFKKLIILATWKQQSVLSGLI